MCSRCRELTGCQPAMLERAASSGECQYRSFHKHRLNRERFHMPPTRPKGSAKKKVYTCTALLRVVRLSLALPGSCLGCAFTQPPPLLLRYGAGLARQTFCLAPLSSPARRASQGNPPVLDFPHALVVGTPSARAATTTSPKPVIRDGAALTTRRLCARRIACTSLHMSICITGEHETQIEEVFPEWGNASLEIS